MQPPVQIQQSILNLKQRFKDEIERIEKDSALTIAKLQEERDFWEREAKMLESRWQEAESRYQSALQMNQKLQNDVQSDDNDTEDSLDGIVTYRELDLEKSMRESSFFAFFFSLGDSDPLE